MNTTATKPTGACARLLLLLCFTCPLWSSGQTWTSVDVGAVGSAGSSGESGGVVTVRGSGEDIWNTSDEFHFRYLNWTGNAVFTARVTGLTDTNAWAKAGIMFRESTAPNARHAMMVISPQNGTAFQRRTTTGGASEHTGGISWRAFPWWLRLTRDGNVITAFESANGTSWTQVGSLTLDLPSSYLVGLGVTSHNDGALTTASFDNITWSGGSPPPLGLNAPTNLAATVRSSTRIDLTWNDNSSNETGFQVEYSQNNANFFLFTTTAANATGISLNGLQPSTTYYFRVRAVNDTQPSAYSNVASGTTLQETPPTVGPTWTAADVGAVAAAGSSSFSGSTWTVNGSGNDIWENGDEFHYRYLNWSGDGVFIARVMSMTNTNGWAKAGIMLRESLAPGARHVFIGVNPGNAAGWFRRLGTNGPSDFTISVYEIARMWIKLVRSGNTFTAFQSGDGTNWTAVGSAVTLDLPVTTLAGLAVTSHNDGVLCTATFENVGFSGGGGTSPTPPLTPTGLTATANSSTRIDLAWTDNATNETSYQIYRATTNDNAAFALVAEPAANATSYADAGLNPGTTYYYRVRAMVGTTPSGYSNTSSATTPAGPAPEPWQRRDIGNVGVAGSDDASGSTITVRGSGSDIWDTADAFRFVYRAVTGDCVVEARIASLTNTDGWTKAGVMIRESEAANARNVFLLLNTSSVLVFQARATPGGTTAMPAGPWWVSSGYWVRLVRTGNTFSAYSSPDAVNWTLRSTTSMTMSATALVGFAVTSHNNGALATGVFGDPFIQ